MAILELLLLHGADMRLIDADGGTCLHAAVYGGQTEALAYLLDHGGDLLLDEPNRSGGTALHLSAELGRLDCGRLLLETCADANARNARGESPLRVALQKDRRDLVSLIAEFGGTAAGRRGTSAAWRSARR